MKKDLEIVGDTRRMSRIEWLDARRTGIGGSDVGSILGIGFQSALTVYRDKAGLLTRAELEDAEDFSESEKAEFGNEMEDVAASVFAKRTGFKVENVHQMLRDPVFKWKLANVDRIYHNGTSWGVLELKNIEFGAKDEWKSGILGQDGAAPEKYIHQVCWYADILGLTHAHLAAVVRGCRLVVVAIPPSLLRQYADASHTACGAFWEDFTTGTMPRLAGTEKDLEALAKRETATEVALMGESEGMSLRTRVYEAKSRLKAAEAEYDSLKVEIASQMGGPGTAFTTLALVDGTKVAEYRQSSRKTTDMKMLQAHYPAAFAACVSEKPISSLYITLK